MKHRVVLQASSRSERRRAARSDLTDVTAKVVIYEAFVKRQLGSSYDGDSRAPLTPCWTGESDYSSREYDEGSDAKELLHSGLLHEEWLSQILLAGNVALHNNFGAGYAVNAGR